VRPWLLARACWSGCALFDAAPTAVRALWPRGAQHVGAGPCIACVRQPAGRSAACCWSRCPLAAVVTIRHLITRSSPRSSSRRWRRGARGLRFSTSDGIEPIRRAAGATHCWPRRRGQFFSQTTNRRSPPSRLASCAFVPLVRSIRRLSRCSFHLYLHLNLAGAPSSCMSEASRVKAQAGLTTREAFMEPASTRMATSRRGRVARVQSSSIARDSADGVSHPRTPGSAYVRDRFPRRSPRCVRIRAGPGGAIAFRSVPPAALHHGRRRQPMNGRRPRCRSVAAGEVACRRLWRQPPRSSNSLLEGLVFGSSICVGRP